MSVEHLEKHSQIEQQFWNDAQLQSKKPCVGGLEVKNLTTKTEEKSNHCFKKVIEENSKTKVDEQKINNKKIEKIGCFYGAVTKNIFKIACFLGCSSVVKMLISNIKEEDINAQDRVGETLFYKACAARDLAFVRYLLKRPKRNLALVKALLKHPNIDVNKENKAGGTPLYSAVFSARFSGNLALVKILLNHPNIDVNKGTKAGWTPLYSATGWTPRYYASFSGKLALVKILLNHPNIDVNKETKAGWTPLHSASFFGNLALVKILLNHPNIDVNKQNKDGLTALHWACGYRYPEIALSMVKALLSHEKIDVNLTDKDGESAFTVAKNKRYTNIVDALKKRH